MGFSGLVGLVFALFQSEPLLQKALPFSTAALFLASVVGANVVGYALYAKCLKLCNATFVSLAGFLVPLLVSVFAYFGLGEELSLAFFEALLAILLGLLLFYCDPLSLKGVKK
jgi:drug/metabolite transporter (DMT)-like permease